MKSRRKVARPEADEAGTADTSLTLADAVQLVAKAEQEFDRAEEHRVTAKAALQSAMATALAIAKQTIDAARAVTIDENKQRRREHSEMMARVMTTVSRIAADLPPDDENKAGLIQEFQKVWGWGSVLNDLHPTEGTGVLFSTELTPSLSAALDYARVTYPLLHSKIKESELRQQGEFMKDAKHDLNAVAANLGLSFEAASEMLTGAMTKAARAEAKAASDPVSRARRVVRRFERRQAKNPDLPVPREVVDARSYVNRANYQGGKRKTINHG